MALASNGYQCVGGPKDGEWIQVRPGTTVVQVVMKGPHRITGADAAHPDLRHGEYHVRRHPTLGYCLRWTYTHPSR